MNIRIKDTSKAEKVEAASRASGREWEDAIQSAIVKEILIPRWQIIIKVPIRIIVRGQPAYQYPSKLDLARLKVQRGIRSGGTRFPEAIMEVREPGPAGGLKEVRAVEITLVEDFKGTTTFPVHKVAQFDETVRIMQEKYKRTPIYYYFVCPREPSNETKDFIVGTLTSSRKALRILRSYGSL